ncbi:hypothetical protein CsatA_007048 [Cannabis sativa]
MEFSRRQVPSSTSSLSLVGFNGGPQSLSRRFQWWTAISLSSVSMVDCNLSLVGFNGGLQSLSRRFQWWTAISLSSVSMIDCNLSLVGFNGGPQSYSLIHRHHEARVPSAQFLLLLSPYWIQWRNRHPQAPLARRRDLPQKAKFGYGFG